MKENATRKTQARYNRLAPIYDLMEAAVEGLAFRHWRERLWDRVQGERILDVGVGTGKNVPYYPADAHVTAIDISDRMLTRAKERAREGRATVDLVLMDGQRLGFPDGAFDAAVATFVFCSIPDAVQELEEVNRVVKPGGRIVLLEHVRMNVPVVGKLMDIFDPLVVRLMGPHINRHTAENVRKAGLDIERADELIVGGLVKMIFARST